MRRIVGIILGVVAVIAFLYGIVFRMGVKNNVSVSEKKLTVVTTLFPLYDFAKAIGGDAVEVTLLLPPGVEAHSFEPKPSDIVKINESDVFVYTGKFMEPWAEEVIAGISKGKTTVVDASAGVSFLSPMTKNTDVAGSVDPHVWLDFDNAEMMVRTLERNMEEKDPGNAETYKQNADAYVGRLMVLDRKYSDTLSTCQSKNIVYGGHYAFGYLAHRYGLNYTAAEGLSPDAEPTAQDLVALVTQIRKDKISYVFYEELASPKIAETLANETGAQLLLLNAAHNITKDDMQNGVTFVNIMERNLENLRVGLRCF